MILSPWPVFFKLFDKIVFYVLTTLACKKTSKKPPKIHAKCMKKTIKRTYCFARTYFSHLGLNLEGLGTLKWEPKSHIWRPKLKKSEKKLIFGRPFLDQHSFRVEKISWGSPESISGPLEVNFNDSRGRISWIFALNFCLLICTPNWMRRSSRSVLNK